MGRQQACSVFTSGASFSVGAPREAPRSRPFRAAARWPGTCECQRSLTNRRPISLALLAGVISFGSAAPSRAADPAASTVATPPPEPSVAVGIDVGLASAVGLAGVTLTQAVGQFFRVEVGVGYGFSGYQLSLMPKIALGARHDHFVAGAGVSVAFPIDPARASGNPVWLNIDAVGYEHRFDMGIALSVAVGLTAGLGGGEIWPARSASGKANATSILCNPCRMSGSRKDGSVSPTGSRTPSAPHPLRLQDFADCGDAARFTSLRYARRPNSAQRPQVRGGGSAGSSRPPTARRSGSLWGSRIPYRRRT